MQEYRVVKKKNVIMGCYLHKDEDTPKEVQVIEPEIIEKTDVISEKTLNYFANLALKTSAGFRSCVHDFENQNEKLRKEVEVLEKRSAKAVDKINQIAKKSRLILILAIIFGKAIGIIHAAYVIINKFGGVYTKMALIGATFFNLALADLIALIYGLLAMAFIIFYEKSYRREITNCTKEIREKTTAIKNNSKSITWYQKRAQDEFSKYMKYRGLS